MSDELGEVVPFDGATVASTATPAPAAAAPGGGGVVEEKMPAVPSTASAAPGAAIATAETPPDLTSAFESKKAREEYFYNEEARCFMRKNEAGSWVSLAEGAFVRHLKKEHGLRDKPVPGKITSQAHDVVWDVENNRRVAYAGVIAGYKAGLQSIAGRRVLVTEEPVFITPKRGEWPIYGEVLKNLFCGSEPADDNKTIEIDQRPWVFAWLKHVMECFYDGKTDPGLAFCLAGDPNCGKSFFALTVRWMLGDRVAKSYRYMMGDDSFNRDLVEAPLWLIDDENQADTDYRMRQKFGGEVKMVTANNEFRVRAMHMNPFAIPLLRRLMVLCNLQGTRLLVLPPLDGDVDDKLHLYKGYARPQPAQPITLDTPPEAACWPMPMPTRTVVEREQFRAAVRGELPAFLWWLLNEYKVPSVVSAGARFGMESSYRHPAIVAALAEHSPHMRLWDLIVRSKVVFNTFYPGSASSDPRWEAKGEWRGSAGDLEQLLKKNQDSQLSKEERGEVKASNWLGRTLDLCARHFGERVCRQERSGKKGQRVWILTPRPEDAP